MRSWQAASTRKARAPRKGLARSRGGCQRLWLLGQRRPGAGPLLGKGSVNQRHVVVDLGDLLHQLHVLAHVVHKAQAQHDVKAAKLAEVYPEKVVCDAIIPVPFDFLEFENEVRLVYVRLSPVDSERLIAATFDGT
jgi:hypothetical protein